VADVEPTAADIEFYKRVLENIYKAKKMEERLSKDGEIAAAQYYAGYIQGLRDAWMDYHSIRGLFFVNWRKYLTEEEREKYAHVRI